MTYFCTIIRGASRRAEIIPANLIRIMPAQENATAIAGNISDALFRYVMKKYNCLSLSLFCFLLGEIFVPLHAQIGKKNTLTDSIESIESVMVRAADANNGHYMSSELLQMVSNKDILKINNTGRDIPLMLQNQISTLSTSDAGNGIGYTGIRVRGSDATRTNITLNGVPINDAESQGTFWVNMPDLASSLSRIRLTRGVGSSVNGAGAFGATVAMETETNTKPQITANIRKGSYGTSLTSIVMASGDVPFGKNPAQRFNLETRFSTGHSDGYINQSSSDLKSHWASIGYKNSSYEIKFLSFGGHEKTHQAWWGIPIEKYTLGDGADQSKTREEALLNHYNRNIGSIYRNTNDSVVLFNSSPNTYNYYTYKNEIDDYQQQHQHLYFYGKTGNKGNMSTTLFHTLGKGFFEQYRINDSFNRYGIYPIRTAKDSNSTQLISASDLIRRRCLHNNLFGIIANWQYQTIKNTWIIGGGVNQYVGNHFGMVTQIFATENQTLNPKHEYYRSNGNKFDANLYIKLDHTFQNNIMGFIDLQIRKVKHKGLGKDNDQRPIAFVGDFVFFNPKLGIYSRINRNNSISASAGVANHEPARSDFTDNPMLLMPKPESMLDIELNHKFSRISPSKKNTEIGTTLYYMKYKNQLVVNGALNDVGTALRVNVPNSYRSGIEINAAQQIFSITNANKTPDTENEHLLTVVSALSLSQNIVALSPVSWMNYANNSRFDTLYKNAPIAYSPNLIASAGLDYHYNEFSVFWRTKYAGRQYLDNTGNQSRSIEAFTHSELSIAYTRKTRNGLRIEINFQLINIFNTRYVSNAYTYGYFYGNDPQKTPNTAQLIQEVFVFPQAPRNILMGLRIGF